MICAHFGPFDVRIGGCKNLPSTFSQNLVPTAIPAPNLVLNLLQNWHLGRNKLENFLPDTNGVRVVIWPSALEGSKCPDGNLAFVTSRPPRCPDGDLPYIGIIRGPGTINLLDEQEVIFHRGHSEGKVIDAPNSEYCNIKLALARMMHACGASDMIAEVYGDDDDDEAIVNQPVYLGGPFVQLR